MSLDFEREYGVNAAYVQGLYEEWKVDASRVDESWRKLFERSEERPGRSSERQEEQPEPAPVAATATATVEPPRVPERAEPAETTSGLEPLVGLASRIAVNMTESLELPTATSVRTLPAKALVENRAILNEHLEVRALGKASFTHLIAYALAKALAEFPNLRSAFVEQNGKPFKRTDAHVNLGIAIDLETPRGRMLVVPSIKAAETLDFATFRATYEDLVARARAGKLRFVGPSKRIDTVYIDNAVQAHMDALDRLEIGAPCAGKAYFISQGAPIALDEMVNKLLKAAGLAPEQRRVSVKMAMTIGFLYEQWYQLTGNRNEPPMTRFLAEQLSTAHWFNIGAARRDLGYQPKVTLAEGMVRVSEWWMREGKLKHPG